MKSVLDLFQFKTTDSLRRNLFSGLLISLFLTACASNEVAPDASVSRKTGDYESVVEKYTDKARRYSGFYNTLEIEATFLNSDVLLAQLEQKSALYQWNENRLGEEKSKFENRLSKESEIFLSFYTPDRKNDNLAKPDSIWKIFLDVDGRRFEGKATRIKLSLSELASLYPYHNRFYTPYAVTFPVSMRAIENKAAKLTITGAIGSATLNFSK